MEGAMDAAELAVAGSALRARVNAYRPYLESLLDKLVRTESHASQPDGVNTVGSLIAEPLEQAGFTIERMGHRPGDEPPGWLADLMLPGQAYSSVGDVWQLHRDGADCRVLILGDLDTAFLPGCSETFAYRTEGDAAFGPGVADAKGGLVVLVGAIRLLQDREAALPTITVVLSPDEQAGSLRSRPVIERAAAVNSVCLCLECAREGGNLMGSRSCCGVGRITVIGREAHAGTQRQAGLSAISGFAKLVDPLELITDASCGRFVTVTQVSGGWRRSLVPGECSFTLDLRLRDSADWEELESSLRAVVRDHAETRGLVVDIRLAQHRPSVMQTSAVEPLIATVASASRALGMTLNVISSNAAGSSAFVGHTPMLDGMGPPGGNLMTLDEQISLSGLTERACLLALTLLSLGSSN
jgi:glutamate carboxypeptidase